jgi:hypothetical protein
MYTITINLVKFQAYTLRNSWEKVVWTLFWVKVDKILALGYHLTQPKWHQSLLKRTLAKRLTFTYIRDSMIAFLIDVSNYQRLFISTETKLQHQHLCYLPKWLHINIYPNGCTYMDLMQKYEAFNVTVNRRKFVPCIPCVNFVVLCQKT